MGSLERQATTAAYEALDPIARATVTVATSFFPQPMTIADMAGLRLTEFTLHSWDVLVTFDPAAPLPTPGPELLIDRVSFMIGFLSRPAELNGAQGVLAVETHEPDRRFGLLLGETISQVDAPANPDGRLELPGEAWLRLFSGRLAPEHTPASVVVSGDLIDLPGLRRVFPGY
jgi:hypothetical protein